MCFFSCFSLQLDVPPRPLCCLPSLPPSRILARLCSVENLRSCWPDRYCIMVVLFENLVGCSSILRRRMRPRRPPPLAEITINVNHNHCLVALWLSRRLSRRLIRSDFDQITCPSFSILVLSISQVSWWQGQALPRASGAWFSGWGQGQRPFAENQGPWPGPQWHTAIEYQGHQGPKLQRCGLYCAAWGCTSCRSFSGGVLMPSWDDKCSHKWLID